MSARSTQITLNNYTNYLLVLTNSQLDHGIWNGGPVNQVTPGQTGRVIGQNDSDGLMTGDQGSMTYAAIGIGTNSLPVLVGYVTINWDNPYSGDNAYSTSVTTGSGLEASYSGGSGNNASVSFSLKAQ